MNNQNAENNIMATAHAVKGAEEKLSTVRRSVNSFSKMSDGLSELNTNRGGNYGLKGFVAEEMEAAESSARGRATAVLNDNGIADLRHTKVNGAVVDKQLKIGYKSGRIDFARYKGQTIVVDKGNPNFKAMKAAAAKEGVKLVEGHVSEAECRMLADAMRVESKITGSKNAVVVPKVYSGAKMVGAAHTAGVNAAKVGAASGAGFSAGSHIVKVIRGKEELGEAAVGIACDTAKAAAVSYGIGSAGSLVASTSTGAAAMGAISSAASTVASAPVIGTAVGAVGTAASSIAGIGTAAATTAVGATGTALTAAGSAVSGLASGTALAGAVGSGVSMIGAAAGAVGAVTIAAAPVLAVGCVLGGLCSWLFDD